MHAIIRLGFNIKINLSIANTVAANGVTHGDNHCSSEFTSKINVSIYRKHRRGKRGHFLRQRRLTGSVLGKTASLSSNSSTHFHIHLKLNWRLICGIGITASLVLKCILRGFCLPYNGTRFSRTESWEWCTMAKMKFRKKRHHFWIMSTAHPLRDSPLVMLMSQAMWMSMCWHVAIITTLSLPLYANHDNKTKPI